MIVATLIGLAAGAPHVVEKHFSGRPDTISTRESFFHLSLDYFKANPLFGAGFGAARQQIGFVIHSTFFALLGEAGVLAAACIVLLIGTVLFRGLRLLRRPTAPNDMLGLLCTNACMIVVSFGIDGLLHRHWWIVLGLLLGATYGATATSEQRRPRHAAARESAEIGVGIGTG